MATIVNPSNKNETITYNRIGGTQDNPIYFNDPLPAPTGTPATLTGDSLAPAQKLQVPSINTVNSGSNAIIASTAQSNIDYNQAIADAKALKQASGNQSEQMYSDILSQVKDLTQQKSTAQANQVNLETQAGLPEQQKALADINTQIADQQVQLRAEQERIRNTPMSKEQAQQENNVLSDTYGRRLADLAIRQSAAQGNIQAIKDNADRQTKLLLAPIDNQINYYKEFATTYADQLSKKEQQQLSLIQTNLQDQRKSLEDLQNTKKDLITKISENGGGSTNIISQIQGASNSKEALLIAAKSGYLSKPTKITTPIAVDGKISSITQSIIDNPTLFDDLTPTVKQKVIAELQVNGYGTANLGLKGLSDGAITKINDFNSSITQLSDIKSKIAANPDLVSPIKGLEYLNPYSAKQGFRAELDKVRQNVGKALEGGVLRKEDEEKYKKILATIYDTPETAEAKLDSLISSMQSSIEDYKNLQRSGGKSLDVNAPLTKKGSVSDTTNLRTKYGY